MVFKKIISDSLKYPLENITRLIVLYIFLLAIFLVIPGIFALGYRLRIIDQSVQVYILFLAGFLVIPAIFSLGYIFRIIDQSVQDFDDSATFRGWRDAFADGLRFLVVNLIYFIIPSIILFILIGAVLAHVTSYLIVHLAVYLFFLIIGLFALLFSIALDNMAHEQRFMAAFKFKKIFRVIKRIGRQNYLNYVALFLIVEALGGLIFALRSLALTNLIISLILVFLFIYVALFWARFAGLVYRTSFEEV